MKLLLSLALIFTLSGCAGANFQNRLAVTPDCSRGFLASLYGKFGLTTEIEPADLAPICKKEVTK